MSKRKYLFGNEISIKCSDCKGKGGKRIYSEYLPYHSEWIICNKCNGLKKITITSKHKKFLFHYKEMIEKYIIYYTKQLREIKQEEGKCSKRLKESCKELDKIVNKRRTNK